MTKGQLFREVWLELHPDMSDEGEFRIADMIIPDVVNQEIPPEDVEALREAFLEEGRRIDAESPEEGQKILNQKLSMN